MGLNKRKRTSTKRKPMTAYRRRKLREARKLYQSVRCKRMLRFFAGLRWPKEKSTVRVRTKAS